MEAAALVVAGKLGSTDKLCFGLYFLVLYIKSITKRKQSRHKKVGLNNVIFLVARGVSKVSKGMLH